MPSRDATTHWHGDLKTGSGTVTLDSSNAGQFPVSFPTRAGDPNGQTSPEELIAAAHSACYAMSLSGALARAGTPVQELDVSAEVTVDRAEGGGLTITSIDDAAFQEAAAAAKAGCPVSRALAAVPSITLKARLRG
jgi:osmotically inducible protein OsmC